ncbi:hypothetical protein AB0368_33705 [Actinoplanes sp. NPDC051475]|uniref:hypothetical protein n=1 Tax=Actinoplanes sp. NPDC051475 TaxID=3157225 RepID=UPI00344F30DF
MTVRDTADGAAPLASDRSPAWRRRTNAEARWPAALAALTAIALQLSVPQRLTLPPGWLLPWLELAVLVVIVAVNPRRITGERAWLRPAGMILVAVASLANATSAALLIWRLAQGREGDDAASLLVVGGTVWATNVIVFALWYWELDRGGPAARARADTSYPDFLFPQMTAADVAHPDWEPGFADYLYVSFTNATAFSPTDTMPLTRWAKLTMLLQSALSLLTMALIVARAVNVLG